MKQQKPSFPPQQSSQSDEPYFGPSQQRQQFNQVPPGSQQTAGAQFGAQPPQYAQPPTPQSGYNMPPQQQGIQPEMPAPEQMGNEPPLDNSENNPMYFTSVNTDKFKRKGKKPVNPRHKPKKSFLGKLFNRDSSL